MNKKTIHIVNITLGIIIFGRIGLFLAWLYFTFETIEVVPINLTVIIILFILWIAFYKLQLRNPRIKPFLIFFIIEILLLLFIYIQLSVQVSFEFLG
ncbi:hypothetical protein ACFQ4N_09645 [Oceanobacillus iheyensis]|uniref:hypothetical protein n=1 Tax=Oceanobacillus iheyensis TaxID=182710 RepID=UPI003630365D